MVTSEGCQSMSMPVELGDGKFVPILTTKEILERKTTPTFTNIYVHDYPVA